MSHVRLSQEKEEIEAVVARRGITEVLHFTTNKGLLGVLATGFLKSRELLDEDKYLEHIYTPNARYRRDRAWVGHVSLSISRINYDFFRSSGRWQRDEELWWCVLAFDSVILTHEGVFFTTTNNIYTGVKRGEGVFGLEALFDERVLHYGGRFAERKDGMSDAHPTSVQAEVLYPRQVPIELLRRAYFIEPAHAAEALAMCTGLSRADIATVVSPDLLKGPTS